MEERVTFVSEGLKLAGVLHLPDDGRGPRERRPAFLVLHGFGSNKDSGGSTTTAKMLAGFGYAALRFDMRGCGQSEGRVAGSFASSRSRTRRARSASSLRGPRSIPSASV